MNEILRQVLQNLRANKLRSFLTMFGILWGVISVVVLSATGEGFQRGNQRVLEELGKNVGIIWGGRTSLHAGGERAGRPILLTVDDARALARAISIVEDETASAAELIASLYPHTGRAYLIGITGAPGAGKSTLVDRLTAEIRRAGLTVGIVAVDPTSPFTGGAILGDRVRMQDHATDEGVFIRSMATRGHLGGLALATPQAVRVLDAAGKPWVIIETVGVGQVEDPRGDAPPGCTAAVPCCSAPSPDRAIGGRQVGGHSRGGCQLSAAARPRNPDSPPRPTSVPAGVPPATRPAGNGRLAARWNFSDRSTDKPGRFPPPVRGRMAVQSHGRRGRELRAATLLSTGGWPAFLAYQRRGDSTCS